MAIGKFSFISSTAAVLGPFGAGYCGHSGGGIVLAEMMVLPPVLDLFL